LWSEKTVGCAFECSCRSAVDGLVLQRQLVQKDMRDDRNLLSHIIPALMHGLGESAKLDDRSSNPLQGSRAAVLVVIE